MIINSKNYIVTDYYINELKNKLPKPKYIKEKFLPFAALILKGENLFETKDSYIKFLGVLKGHKLANYPVYLKMLKLFAERVGLPEEVYPEDLTLIGNDQSSLMCSKELFTAYFPNVLNIEELCPRLNLSGESLVALKNTILTGHPKTLNPKVLRELLDFYENIHEQVHKNALLSWIFDQYIRSPENFEPSFILDINKSGSPISFKQFACKFCKQNIKQGVQVESPEISLSLEAFTSLWIDYPIIAPFIAQEIDGVLQDPLTLEQSKHARAFFKNFKLDKTDTYTKLVLDLKNDPNLAPFFPELLEVLAKIRPIPAEAFKNDFKLISKEKNEKLFSKELLKITFPEYFGSMFKSGYQEVMSGEISLTNLSDLQLNQLHHYIYHRDLGALSIQELHRLSEVADWLRSSSLIEDINQTIFDKMVKDPNQYDEKILPPSKDYALAILQELYSFKEPQMVVALYDQFMEFIQDYPKIASILPLGVTQLNFNHFDEVLLSRSVIPKPARQLIPSILVTNGPPSYKPQSLTISQFYDAFSLYPNILYDQKCLRRTDINKEEEFNRLFFDSDMKKQAKLHVIKGWSILLNSVSEIKDEAQAKKALEFDPHSAIAHELLGECAFKNGNIQNAIDSFSTALKMKPTLLHAKERLTLLSKEPYVQESNNPHVHEMRAKILQSDPLASEELLFESCKKAAEYGSKDPSIHLRLIIWHLMRFEYDLAEKYLRKALSPENAKTIKNWFQTTAKTLSTNHFLCGYVSQKCFEPNFNMAEEHFRLVDQKDSFYKPSMEFYGDILQDQVDKGSENPKAYVYLLQILSLNRVNNAERIRGLLEKGLKIKATAPALHYHYALSLISSSEYDLAGEHFTKLLELNSNLRPLEQAISLLFQSKPDYEKAQVALNLSDKKESWFDFCSGYLNLKKSKPDYKKAKEHFEKVTYTRGFFSTTQKYLEFINGVLENNPSNKENSENGDHTPKKQKLV